MQLWKTNPVVRFNVLASGLWFYGYNDRDDDDQEMLLPICTNTAKSHRHRRRRDCDGRVLETLICTGHRYRRRLPLLG